MIIICKTDFNFGNCTDIDILNWKEKNSIDQNKRKLTESQKCGLFFKIILLDELKMFNNEMILVSEINKLESTICFVSNMISLKWIIWIMVIVTINNNAEILDILMSLLLEEIK